MSSGKGLSLALYYLQARARTEQELRDKLTRKQVPPQEIETVLLKLKELGYVNDQKFAKDFQRSRNDYKPTGLRRLRLELQLKGVDRHILEQLEATKEAEYQLALAAAETRLRQYQHLEPAVFERRMIAFLARRGFGYDTIKQVISQFKID